MLSETQKAQIRTYLGYPDGFRYRDTRLESVMDSLSPEAEVQIASILGNLATVDQQVLDAAAAAALGIKRVDEITFKDDVDGISVGFISAKAAGKYLVGRLSIIVGTPINSRAFGSAGYPGDTFEGNGLGAANFINLG